MESQALKATHRKIFKANLIQLHQRKKVYIADCKVQKKLKAQLDFTLRFHKSHSKAPINLLFYYPLTLEFDIRKLLRFYRKQRNVQVFLPKIEGESFKAVKYRLPLQRQAFGVYEPSNSNFRAKIHCAIVPVLGVDEALGRIGFGKGMYDRFFEANQVSKVIFVCRAFHYLPHIITQDYDIKGDVYITPFKTLKHYNKIKFFTLNQNRKGDFIKQKVLK